MLIDYDPIILTTIIRVAPNILSKVKEAIVEATLKLETDDRAYLYIPGDYKVLLRRGHFIAKVSNYVPPPEDLIVELAIKQTVHILTHEDKNSRKFVFIILDQYDPTKEEYGVTKGFNIDLKEDTNCQFVICDLGENESLKSLCQRHPRCQYVRIDNVAGLGEKMIEVYYPEEERTVIDKEFVDKYGKTPAEARQELKEKYAQDIPVETDTEIGDGIEGQED